MRHITTCRALQRFLFRTPGLPNVDRAALKTAILQTIESESASRQHCVAVTRCWLPRKQSPDIRAWLGPQATATALVSFTAFLA